MYSAIRISRQRNIFPSATGSAAFPACDQFLLPDHPEILKVSNKKTADGAFVGLNQVGRLALDSSYADMPSLVSLLYAWEIPPTGGDTLFNNMYAAYETLPQATKDRICGLKAEFLIGSARFYYTEQERPALTAEQLASVPPVEHLVVRAS